MPGLIKSGTNKGASNDCVTAGFPIHFRETYEPAEGDDTAATPLVPSAAFAGVMNGLSINNDSCNELKVAIEFWSSESDCDGCTADTPVTEVQNHIVKKNEALHFDGYVVDYSIDGGTFIKDGCVDVMTSRVTSKCCKMTGLTTTTNTLVVPTI